MVQESFFNLPRLLKAKIPGGKITCDECHQKDDGAVAQQDAKEKALFQNNRPLGSGEGSCRTLLPVTM